MKQAKSISIALGLILPTSFLYFSCNDNELISRESNTSEISKKPALQPSSSPSTTTQPSSSSTPSSSSSSTTIEIPSPSSSTDLIKNPNDCPSGKGPEMVRIHTPEGKTFCIDKTEVSQGQYNTFVEAKYDGSNLDGICKGKTKFEPYLVPPCKEKPYLCDDGPLPGTACTTEDYTPQKTPNAPMGCVDFCKAKAFCLWAGKRLCSKIGGQGKQKVIRTKSDDPKESEWFHACTSGGKGNYPYGNTYQPGVCVDKEYEKVTGSSNLQTTDATSMCKGSAEPFSQVVNLLGNMAEWGELYDDDKPEFRHGSKTSANAFDCRNNHGIIGPGLTLASLGFRCCADLRLLTRPTLST